jgi:hypothetical protein
MRYRWLIAGALLLSTLVQAVSALVSSPRVAEGREAPITLPRQLGEAIRAGTVDSQITRERVRQQASDDLAATFAEHAASRQEQRQRMVEWIQAQAVTTTPGSGPRAGPLDNR